MCLFIQMQPPKMKITSVQVNMKQVSYFDEEERAGCFTSMVFLTVVTVGVLWGNILDWF